MSSRFDHIEVTAKPGAPPVPNPKMFNGSRSPLQTTGKAHIDANGVQRNAIGLESTAAHPDVALEWQQNGCKPLSDFIDKLAAERKLKRDVYVRESSLRLRTIDELMDGQGRFQDRDTLFALVGYLKLRGATIKDLIANGYEDVARTIINTEMDRREITAAKSGKGKGEYLVRYLTDKDGKEKIRRVLTDDYGIINNEDVVNWIANALPRDARGDVLSSHCHSDMNRITGNLLLPKRVITLPDSEYSVGVAYKNDEIGEGCVEVYPFVFRAICRNGNIWSMQESSIKIHIVHRGKRGVVDTVKIQGDITKLVTAALSLGVGFATQISQSTQVSINVKKADKLIAMLSNKVGLQIPMAQAWWSSFQREPSKGTASGVYNALTAASKSFQGDEQYQMQSAASSILTPSLTASPKAMQTMWDSYQSRAETVEQKLVQQLVKVGR